jgi:hypothetical protein
MVVETMRARSEDQTGEADILRTPGRVRDVIAARLERLSERARQLAALASAIGQEFDFALLDRAAAIGTHATAEGWRNWSRVVCCTRSASASTSPTSGFARSPTIN